MRSVWSCSSCVLLLLSAVLPRGAAAMYQGKRDTVHRVDKVHVVVQYERRDAASVCPTKYSLCPASLDGGCCPDGYACAASSCYATTAATASACGRVGYFACGADVGGGCCPEGYICGISDCTVPAGVSYSQNCPVDYYLCPSSYNYGCCQTGYGCALNACYATAPLSYVLTFTTTDGGVAETITSTSVSTPTAPSGLPTSDTSAAFPKFIPTTVDKVPATSSPSPSGGGDHGLTTAQLGGIIGGAIGLLLIVLVATFLILRRLRSTVKAVESSGKGDSSSGVDGTTDGPKDPPAMTQHPRFRPTTSEVDAMDFDPLMEQASATTTPGPAGHGRSRSASEYSASQQATPFPTSGTSVDSGPAGSYFDIPRVHNVPGRHANSVVSGGAARNSVDSQSQYGYAPVAPHHGRHWSTASELSAGSGGGGGGSGPGSGVGSPLMPAELDIAGGFVPELPGSDTEEGSGGQGRRRSSSAVSPRGTSPSLGANPSPMSNSGGSGRPPLLSHGRRRSEGGGHGRDRSDSSAGGGAGGLNVVEEDAEMIHGYYGPTNAAAGQTGAGLNVYHDISSPVGPRFGS
ncbi:hypothetical protein NKR23_g4382 [Pleurostoma richardsiae]|uniref:Uncharacterized protein n=1 Tax=Pleurostoma richardsiae TaxID=41990 RepID=A0AA38VFZ6_9PEZI|nr:hypothetical protein NKR23_g4382 [Pleurostoma richardsiae]